MVLVRAEVVQKNRKTQTQTQTLFSKSPEIKGFRPYTETQKSHRQLLPGIVALVCFRYKKTKGFRSRLTNSTKKKIVSIHFKFVIES